MRLIVNADDFGYTPGVTRGILRAHRDGIVTATTLMANAPDTEDAAKAARADKTLDVGVHLVAHLRSTGDGPNASLARRARTAFSARDRPVPRHRPRGSR